MKPAAAAFGVIALVCAAAAAAGPSDLRLVAGQTRWFLPSQLRTGDRLLCIAHTHSVAAVVPAPPPMGQTSGSDTLGAGRAQLAIERRPNGATQVTCGPGPALPRRPHLPYVIGQNGLALIRGPNTLAHLERLFGAGSRETHTSRCRVTWFSLRLRASFDASRCSSGSILRTATVDGGPWTSLSGVRVGDPVGRMRWQVPSAKLVSSHSGRAIWRLATAVAHGSHASLLATIGPAGTVTSLTCVVS